MTSYEKDDQNRPATAPYGQQPGGEPQGTPPQYGQEYGTQPQYGQQYAQQPDPYGQHYGQQYGQPPDPYGQQYGQQPTQYGQQYAAQPAYGSPGYGPYGNAVPARPAPVTVAAVLGFIFGAFGVLVTVAFLFLGAVSGGAAGDLDEAIPGFGSFAGAFAGIVIVLGLLALAWTVVMIWGSVRALTGRSRVPLVVGGSISIATTGIAFLGGLGDENTTAGGAFVSFLFLAGAIAIVALLCVRSAAQFFAAHRAARGR